MSTADNSQTKRIARIRQHIAGREWDGGVKPQLNGSSGHLLQKKLGRTIFFNQLASGVIVPDATIDPLSCVCEPLVDPTA